MSNIWPIIWSSSGVYVWALTMGPFTIDFTLQEQLNEHSLHVLVWTRQRNKFEDGVKCADHRICWQEELKL